MPDSRQQLLNLLARDSFRLFDSGDYQLDCGATLLQAEGARLAGRVFFDAIRHQEWWPQAIGGPAGTAAPIVVSVAMLSAQLSQQRQESLVEEPYAGHIHGFLLDAREPERPRGFSQLGGRVVVVDDVVANGGSLAESIGAARAFGFKVVGVIALVESGEPQDREAVAQAASPASFLSIFRVAELRAQHLRPHPASQ